MESRIESALQQFRSGLNCAQSVMMGFEKDFALDRDLALSISCGFGGGMGRLQETCGAVTGAFMVLGLHNCSLYKENGERKEHSYAMVQAFDEQFRKLNGTTSCAKLLNCDLKTPEGRKTAHDQKLFDTICEKCIRDAIRITCELTGIAAH